VTGQLYVDRAVGIVASKTSSLSGVINNAGIAHRPLEDPTDTQMALTTNADLQGMMGVCRAAISIQDTPGERFYFLSFFYGRSLS